MQNKMTHPLPRPMYFSGTYQPTNRASFTSTAFATWTSKRHVASLNTLQNFRWQKNDQDFIKITKKAKWELMATQKKWCSSRLMRPTWTLPKISVEKKHPKTSWKKLWISNRDWLTAQRNWCRDQANSWEISTRTSAWAWLIAILDPQLGPCSGLKACAPQKHIFPC